MLNPLSWQDAMYLAPGVRVRWNNRHTYFGTVIAPDTVNPLLRVQQENGGPEWALNPAVDRIFVVGER